MSISFTSSSIIPPLSWSYITPDSSSCLLTLIDTGIGSVINTSSSSNNTSVNFSQNTAGSSVVGIYSSYTQGNLVAPALTIFQNSNSALGGSLLIADTQNKVAYTLPSTISQNNAGQFLGLSSWKSDYTFTPSNSSVPQIPYSVYELEWISPNQTSAQIDLPLTFPNFTTTKPTNTNQGTEAFVLSTTSASTGECFLINEAGSGSAISLNMQGSATALYITGTYTGLSGNPLIEVDGLNSTILDLTTLSTAVANVIEINNPGEGDTISISQLNENTTNYGINISYKGTTSSIYSDVTGTSNNANVPSSYQSYYDANSTGIFISSANITVPSSLAGVGATLYQNIDENALYITQQLATAQNSLSYYENLGEGNSITIKQTNSSANPAISITTQSNANPCVFSENSSTGPVEVLYSSKSNALPALNIIQTASQTGGLLIGDLNQASGTAYIFPTTVGSAGQQLSLAQSISSQQITIPNVGTVTAIPMEWSDPAGLTVPLILTNSDATLVTLTVNGTGQAFQTNGVSYYRSDTSSLPATAFNDTGSGNCVYINSTGSLDSSWDNQTQHYTDRQMAALWVSQSNVKGGTAGYFTNTNPNVPCVNMVGVQQVLTMTGSSVYAQNSTNPPIPTVLIADGGSGNALSIQSSGIINTTSGGANNAALNCHQSNAAGGMAAWFGNDNPSVYSVMIETSPTNANAGLWVNNGTDDVPTVKLNRAQEDIPLHAVLFTNNTPSAALCIEHNHISPQNSAVEISTQGTQPAITTNSAAASISASGVSGLDSRPARGFKLNKTGNLQLDTHVYLSDSGAGTNICIDSTDGEGQAIGAYSNSSQIATGNVYNALGPALTIKGRSSRCIC